MQDTESGSSPNLMWEIVPGAPLVIAFTGMAHGLNELANFEFVKSTKRFEWSKIFCRDPNHAFYHLGIDDRTKNANDLVIRLRELIVEMFPSRITCIGVSAGGYAALLFGHLLKADTVHAIGPQVVLHEQWGIEHNDPTIYGSAAQLNYAGLAPENDFRDLPKILSSYNGKTKYFIHVGKNCQQDLNHAEELVGCSGMELVLHPCPAHACAGPLLRDSGQLENILLGEPYEDSGTKS